MYWHVVKTMTQCRLKRDFQWRWRLSESDTQRHTPDLTFGLTVPERDWSFILGQEASSAGEAEDSAWFRLVEAQWTGLARMKPVSRVITCWALSWGRDKREKNLWFDFLMLFMNFIVKTLYVQTVLNKLRDVRVFLSVGSNSKYPSNSNLQLQCILTLICDALLWL